MRQVHESDHNFPSSPRDWKQQLQSNSKAMDNIVEDARMEQSFLMVYGKKIMRSSDKSTVGALRIRFNSFFGTSPFVCASLWRKILVKKRGNLERLASPEHLLWALLFLNTYLKEEVLCTLLNSTTKTVRKWVWYMIRSIFEIRNDVVSRQWIMISWYQLILTFLLSNLFRLNGKIVSPVKLALGTKSLSTALISVSGSRRNLIVNGFRTSLDLRAWDMKWPFASRPVSLSGFMVRYHADHIQTSPSSEAASNRPW